MINIFFLFTPWGGGFSSNPLRCLRIFVLVVVAMEGVDVNIAGEITGAPLAMGAQVIDCKLFANIGDIDAVDVDAVDAVDAVSG